jgi:MFS transporter, OFA family, oxalate/formate antiporter
MADTSAGGEKVRFPVALIVGTGIGMCGGMAILFMSTLSIFMLPIINDLAWSRAQVSLLTTSAFAGYALGSPVLGYLFDRLGARLVLAAGVLNQVVMLALMGAIPLSPGLATIIAFEIGFIGAATAPSGYGLIIALSTNRRLGLMLGLTMLGYGLGVTLMPLIVERLISSLGWRDAYIAMAGIAGVLGGAAIVLGVGRSVPGKAARDGATGNYPGVQFAGAIRDHRFWIIVATAVMLAFSGFGVTAHLAAIVTDKGLNPAAAASVVATFGAGLFAGRVGAAILMDKVFAPHVALAMSLLGGAGLLTLNFVSAGQTLLMFLAAFLMGLLTGGEGDTVPFLTRRYFGKHSFGAIFGVIVGSMGLGGIVGPLAFGWTFDREGSYSIILILAATLCAISSVCFLFLGSYRYSASED